MRAAMQVIGNTAQYVPSTTRRETVFSTSWVHTKTTRTILSREAIHRLAMLVHQGSDPTSPYPALVIRESAKFSSRVCPYRFEGVLGSQGRLRWNRAHFP